VALIDPLFSVGVMRKAIWRLWSPFLTRRVRGEEVLFLNYGRFFFGAAGGGVAPGRKTWPRA
jgi:hypothetical protein